MTTKQTDTVAMTEEQLDSVAGGPTLVEYAFCAPTKCRSNRANYTEMVEKGHTGGGNQDPRRSG